MSQIITDLDTIRQLAQQRFDEFEVMRYQLELDDDIVDEQIDALVDSIAKPIVEAVDCTKCGNCCRSLDVYLTPQDAEQLALGIDIPLDQILDQHVDQNTAKLVHEWGQFKQKPCAFLKGNLCSIYTYRPETCRTYPVFTPDFRWTLEDIIQGAEICPIIYNVLNEVVKQVDDLL